MAEYISEPNFGYSELDEQARRGNNVEYALNDLRDLVSAAYPDNSRDSRIEDIEAAIRYFRTESAAYLRELESLVVIAKSGKTFPIDEERYYND